MRSPFGLGLRRPWGLIVAFVAFIVFAALHMVGYQPLARRYERAVRRAEALGMPVGSSDPIVAPRVTLLIEANALAAAEAERQANSGELAARMLGDVSTLAGRHGLVVLATDQGNVSQRPSDVQVRAQVRLRGRWDGLLRLLDELAASGTLVGVDRFVLATTGDRDVVMDLSLSRLVLKRRGGS
jgi:hypothetical protein